MHDHICSVRSGDLTTSVTNGPLARLDKQPHCHKIRPQHTLTSAARQIGGCESASPLGRLTASHTANHIRAIWSQMFCWKADRLSWKVLQKVFEAKKSNRNVTGTYVQVPGGYTSRYSVKL